MQQYSLTIEENSTENPRKRGLLNNEEAEDDSDSDLCVLRNYKKTRSRRILKINPKFHIKSKFRRNLHTCFIIQFVSCLFYNNHQ